MIPFARIGVYGNSAPVLPKIKKLDMADQNMYILYSTGELYARGQQTYSQFGLGNNTRQTSWILIAEGVDKFWSGGCGTLLLLNDGTYKFSGIGATIGSSGTLSTFTDCSAKVAGIPSTYAILNFYVGRGGTLYALDTNKQLFVIGTNNFNEISSPSTVFKLMTDGVDSVVIGNYCYTVRKGTDYYFQGYNSNGCAGVGNVSINAGIPLTKVTSPSSTIASYINTSSNMVFTDRLTYYGAGTNSNNALAGSGTSATPGQYSFSNPKTLTSPFVRFADKCYNITFGNNFSKLIVCEDGFYYAGQNTVYGESGVGSLAVQAGFVKMLNSGQYLNTYSDLMACNSIVAFVNNKDTVYACGALATVLGFSSNVTTLQPLALPK